MAEWYRKILFIVFGLVNVMVPYNTYVSLPYYGTYQVCLSKKYIIIIKGKYLHSLVAS